MPEIPELQVFSQNLHKKLQGKQVDIVTVYKTRRVNVSHEALAEALEGAKLSRVCRDGKQIRFYFSNGHLLAIHLMLTGEFDLSDEEPDSDSKRLSIHFKDGPYLVVKDYKGWATFTLDPDELDAPDALSPKFDLSYLKQVIDKNPSMTAKALLMDQDKIGGIGNAYSDEMLWESRIAPKSKIGKLPDDTVSDLFGKIKSVLNNAIKHIEKDHPDAINGKIREFLNVHRKDQETTPTGHKIICETINGRKCYYTDEQKLY